MRVTATKPNPLEWWTNRPTAIVAALKRLHDAITTGAITHDGDSVLTTHMLNARRKTDGRAGIEIRKEYPKSPNKIDAAMAATLAYECRGDAVKLGLAKPKKKRAARGF
jgi:phage terminase large subunit-like protein